MYLTSMCIISRREVYGTGDIFSAVVAETRDREQIERRLKEMRENWQKAVLAHWFGSKPIRVLSRTYILEGKRMAEDNCSYNLYSYI